MVAVGGEGAGQAGIAVIEGDVVPLVGGEVLPGGVAGAPEAPGAVVVLSALLLDEEDGGVGVGVFGAGGEFGGEAEAGAASAGDDVCVLGWWWLWCHISLFILYHSRLRGALVVGAAWAAHSQCATHHTLILGWWGIGVVIANWALHRNGGALSSGNVRALWLLAPRGGALAVRDAPYIGVGLVGRIDGALAN